MTPDLWSKASVLHAVRTGREELERILADARTDWLVEPAEDDGWSVKDVLAHLAVVENWLATQLERVALCEQPTPDQVSSTQWQAEQLGLVGPGEHPTSEQVDAIRPLLTDNEYRNAFFHERDRDLPLEEILDWWRQSDDRFLAALTALPEDRYATQQWWTGSHTLVATLDPLHAVAHAEAIRQRREGARPEATRLARPGDRMAGVGEDPSASTQS
jgi:hypothetical protein